MFRVETERLLIRPWQPEDRPAYAALTTNPEVMHHINHGRAYSDAEIDEYLARQGRQIAELGICMGAAVEKSSGRVVGISGTQPLGTTSDLELGWIFAPDTWGRGYATEAGRALMQYVFETLDRPRVVAIIDPENLPSKRVAARLGMEYEARYTGVQLGHRKPDIVVDLFARMR